MQVIDRNAVGKRMREARKLAGLNQKMAAWSMGVTNVYLCALEHGTASPSVGLLRAMTLLYRCTCTDLLGF